MAERAKLKYNNKSYYDADLVFISKKELNFYGLIYLSYALDRQNQCLVAFGYIGDKDNKRPILIPFDSLVMYNVGKGTNDLVVDGVVYDDRRLMQVGQGVASLWGASCTGYSVNKKQKKIVFECIEHGEEFVTEIEFNNLKEYL